MKYLIIDDKEDFVNAFYGKFCYKHNHNTDIGLYPFLTNREDIDNLSLAGLTTSQIAQFIANYFEKEKELQTYNKFDNVLIFINVNLKVKDKKRFEQAGIELLIWLRLKGVHNHCVMYSFEEIHTLLQRKPEYLILSSIGTTFLQLPKVFNIDNYADLGMKVASEENVRCVLSHLYNNNELQHRLSNIYGLWFMFNFHNKYFVDEALSFSIFSNDFLKGIDFLQLSVANYLSNSHTLFILTEKYTSISIQKYTIFVY